MGLARFRPPLYQRELVKNAGRKLRRPGAAALRHLGNTPSRRLLEFQYTLLTVGSRC